MDGVKTAERSIYEYNPRIPSEREVLARVERLIAEQRGTCRQRRFAETWILTCKCGALTVTRNQEAPGKFRDDHAKCRMAA